MDNFPSLFFLLSPLQKPAALQQPAVQPGWQLQLLHDNVPQFNYILQERRDGVDWVRAVLKESGEKSLWMSHGDNCNATMGRTILLRDETVHCFRVGLEQCIIFPKRTMHTQKKPQKWQKLNNWKNKAKGQLSVFFRPQKGDSKSNNH